MATATFKAVERRGDLLVLSFSLDDGFNPTHDVTVTLGIGVLNSCVDAAAFVEEVKTRLREIITADAKITAYNKFAVENVGAVLDL
jgi:hypothetical protein